MNFVRANVSYEIAGDQRRDSFVELVVRSFFFLFVCEAVIEKGKSTYLFYRRGSSNYFTTRVMP